MYRDDVVDLYKQKVVYNFGLLKDFAVIYFKLKLLMPNEKEARIRFIQVIKNWFIYNKNESDVLKYIYKEYKNIEDDENVDEVLEILDEYFEKTFEYYDYILEGYEAMIEFKDVYRSLFKEPDFEVLTEVNKNDLIKKISR